MRSEEVKKEIESVLKLMAKAFVTKDIDLYMSLYDSNPELVIYGSQSGEKWTILKDFKEAVVHNWKMVPQVNVTYTYQRIEVHSSGEVAWFATELAFDMEMEGRQMLIPGRLTGVLVKKNDIWKFRQTHYSMEHH